MTTEEVQHLATLSRIAITDDEAAALAGDFDEILHYVDTVRAVSAETDAEPVAGAVSNVLRDDVGTHDAGAYTEALLDAAPVRDGRYVHVKKILNSDDSG